MAEYPEHEKLKALGGKNQTVGDFIMWLGENGMVIAEEEGDGELWPARKNINELIGAFFDIDQNKLEAEKQQMLEALRKGAA